MTAFCFYYTHSYCMPIIVAALTSTTLTLTWFGASAVRFCHIYVDPIEANAMFTQDDMKGRR